MIYLIFEDKKKTKLMRDFDLFEKFKFIGFTATTEKKDNSFVSEWIEDENYALVAQVLNGKYTIKKGYGESFISDGESWGSLNNLCRIYAIEES